MSKNFYITTTLPYVNSDPHIGFAMELVKADVLARLKKLQGFDVFFNTGTDEHGQKLFTGAKEAGKDVKAYVDEYAAKFKELPKVLGISEDVNFIRTTDPHHEKAAEEFWKRCKDNGYIYKKPYKIKYCVGCELKKTDSELQDGKCPLHPNREIEFIDEENYFFKFSAFQQKLLEYYKQNPSFVIPDFRYNEIKSFVERGLEDFSISRLKEKMSWGIPVPNDPNQVMYVWFDALVNYISSLGWPEDTQNFNKFWADKDTETVQYCGKDNLRQQSAMWQAMLMAANLPNTKQIIVNGFITGEGGIKMSKSLGNTVNPFDLIDKYGKDPVRFFLTYYYGFEDSPFTQDIFSGIYNGFFVNGLGNMVSRIMRMAEDNLDKPVSINDDNTLAKLNELVKNYQTFDLAEFTWNEIIKMNSYIQENEPYKVIKVDINTGKKMITELVNKLYTVSSLLEIVIPDTSAEIKELILTNKFPEKPLFLRKD